MTRRRERSCEDRAQVDSSISQGVLGHQQLSETRKETWITSPWAPRRNPSCQHLEPGLLAPRAVDLSLRWSCCAAGPRKQMQRPFGECWRACPGGRGVDASSLEGDLGRLSKRLKPVLPDPALPLVGIYPPDVFIQVARSICTAYSFKPGRN